MRGQLLARPAPLCPPPAAAARSPYPRHNPEHGPAVPGGAPRARKRWLHCVKTIESRSKDAAGCACAPGPISLELQGKSGARSTQHHVGNLMRPSCPTPLRPPQRTCYREHPLRGRIRSSGKCVRVQSESARDPARFQPSALSQMGKFAGYGLTSSSTVRSS